MLDSQLSLGARGIFRSFKYNGPAYNLHIKYIIPIVQSSWPILFKYH